jgi:hypothetical protein
LSRCRNFQTKKPHENVRNDFPKPVTLTVNHTGDAPQQQNHEDSDCFLAFFTGHSTKEDEIDREGRDDDDGVYNLQCDIQSNSQLQ